MADLRVGVLTCSDSRGRPGARDDAGRTLIEACGERGWFVVAYHVCPNDIECIAASLIDMCDAEEADAVFTLGGTGVGSRDVTPEATECVCERFVPGVAEAVRRNIAESDPAQVLSRAISGVRGSTFIVNLPGGIGPTRAAFEYVAEFLETAVERVHED